MIDLSPVSMLASWIDPAVQKCPGMLMCSSLLMKMRKTVNELRERMLLCPYWYSIEKVRLVYKYYTVECISIHFALHHYLHVYIQCTHMVGSLLEISSTHQLSLYHFMSIILLLQRPAVCPDQRMKVRRWWTSTCTQPALRSYKQGIVSWVGWTWTLITVRKIVGLHITELSLCLRGGCGDLALPWICINCSQWSVLNYVHYTHWL